MIISGVDRLAVATIEEAILLRRAGIPGPIHLLGSMPKVMKECRIVFSSIHCNIQLSLISPRM